MNFHGTEEITLSVDPGKLQITNYVDDDSRIDRRCIPGLWQLTFSTILRTSLSLDATEFVHFQIGLPTSTTFCLKEVKAILMFADFLHEVF